jgi:hypothetical protein
MEQDEQQQSSADDSTASSHGEDSPYNDASDEEASSSDAVDAAADEAVMEELQPAKKSKRRIRKRHNYFFTVKEKLAIVDIAYSKANNIRPTARKYGIGPKNIRDWWKIKEKLIETCVSNPLAKTINKGSVPEYLELETMLNDWFYEMRQEDIAVKTENLIAQAIKIDEENLFSFKNGNTDRIHRWVYAFMERWDLCLRRTTRVGQKLSGHLDMVRKDSVAALNNRFAPGGTLFGTQPKYFLNMDQTAIYFEAKSKTVVAPKGVRTVAIRDSGSNSKRCTVCVTISADGTKLPPFFVFKGVPGAKIERALLADNVKGCCQRNGWFDESVIEKYINAILRPYVQESANAVLLCDHYKVHLMSAFVTSCNNLGIDVEYIPPGYTCVLQPVDVGFNASLKRHVRKEHHKWCIEQYRNVANHARLPSPSKENIMNWVHSAYDSIKEESIVNTFRHIGYNCTPEIDANSSELEETSVDGQQEFEVEVNVSLETMEATFDLGDLQIDNDDIRLPNLNEIIRLAAEDALRESMLPDESQFH